MLAHVPVYGFKQWQSGEIVFFSRMAITFGIILLLMTVITIIKPLNEPKVLPKRTDIDLTPTPQLILWGGVVIFITLILHVVFWIKYEGKLNFAERQGRDAVIKII